MSLKRTIAAAVLALSSATPVFAGGLGLDLPRFDWPTPVAAPVTAPAQPVTRGCADQTKPGVPTACAPAK